MAGAALVAFAALVPLSIAGEQIAWGVAFVVLLVATLTSGRGLLRTPLDGPLALHAATIGLSLALTTVPAHDPVEAYDAWRLLAILAVTAAFVRSDRRVARAALFSVLGVAALVSVYGVYQHFSGADWVRGAAHAIRPPANFGRGRFRPTGTFNWYSTFAFVLAVVLALGAGALVHLRRGRTRALIALAMAPAVLALAFTEVRAAWLGLVAGLAVAAWLHSRRTVVLVLGSAGALALVLLLALPGVRHKAATTFDLAYSHNRDRVFMWAHTLEMVGDHPATGVGQGHFTAATHWYYDRYDATAPVRTHAHDEPLHFWATTGPLGLAAYLWIFVAFFLAVVPAYRKARAEADPLASTLAFGAIAGVVTCLAGGLAQTPYFDGEIFYAWVLALAAGTAVAFWMGTAEVPRITPARVLGVAGPAALGILLAFTQGRWDPSLGARGWVSGTGASIRLGVVFALLVAVPLVALSRTLRARLRRDGFAISLALAAAVAVVLYVGIVDVLAPRVGVANQAGPWVLASALTALGVALVLRVAILSPIGWPALVVVVLPAVAVAAWVNGVELPTVEQQPLAKGQPAVVGHDDRVAVASLPPQDARRRFAAAVVSYGSALSSRSCRATVLGGRAILTTDRCAASFAGRIRVDGTSVSCLRTPDRVPEADLAALTCRPVGPRRDLMDLAGANLAIDPARPKVGDPLWRVTRTRVAPCKVLAVHGDIFDDDCDGTGGPGAPLVSPATGRVLGVDIGRGPGGHERGAAAARLLQGRDRDRDGIPDGVDDCLEPDPAQVDSDRDGVGDACDPVRSVAPLGDGQLVGLSRTDRVRRYRLVTLAAGERLVPEGDPLDLDAPRAAGVASLGARFAVAASGDGRILVADATGRVVATTPPHPGWRWYALAAGHLSGPGSPPSVIVAENQRHVLQVFEVGANGIASPTEAPLAGGGRVHALAFAELGGDGAAELVTATSGPGSDVLIAWRRDGARLVPGPPQPLPGGGAVHALAWLPRARVLVAFGDSGRTYLWAAGDPAPVRARLHLGEGGLYWALPRPGDQLLVYPRRRPAPRLLRLAGPPWRLEAAPPSRRPRPRGTGPRSRWRGRRASSAPWCGGRSPRGSAPAPRRRWPPGRRRRRGTDR